MVRVYEQVDQAATHGTQQVCANPTAAQTTYNRELQESGTLGSGTLTVATNNTGSRRCMHLESEANEPNSTSWPAGDWVFRFNVTTGNANVEWSQGQVCRVNSAGANQATIGSNTFVVPLTAGVKTETISGSADAGAAATDRFYMIGRVQRESSAHGTQTATITNDQVMDTPFAALAATAVKDPVMSPGVVPFPR